MRPTVIKVLFASFLFCAAGWVFAADAPATLIKNEDPIALPGIGRVLFGFLITVALAVGLAYAIKRWLPRFANRYAAAGGIQPIVHSVTKNGLRIHLVKIDQQTVFVVEGKSGIATTILPSNSSPALPKTQ